MNRIIKKTMPALLGSLALLSACQSEQEVGSTLYPVEEGSNQPKLYIHDLQSEGNKGTLRVINANSVATVPNDTVSFYVRLSEPAERDSEVSGVEDSTAAVATGDRVVMNEGALQLLSPTVTIAKGSKQSAMPFKVALKKGAALNKLIADGKNGAAALVLKASDGLAVAKNYSKMLINVDYTKTNIYTDGDVSGLTELSTSDYAVYDENYNSLSRLCDGSTSSYWYGFSTNPHTFYISLTGAETLQGIQLLRTARYKFWFVKSLIVETSTDGLTWTEQGVVKYPDEFALSEDEATLRFYSPVSASYIRLVNVLGNASRYIMLGEIKVFK